MEERLVFQQDGLCGVNQHPGLNAFSCLSTFGIEHLGWFPFVQFRFFRESTQDRREQKFVRTHQIVPFLRVIASFDHLQLLMMVAMMIGLALREVEATWACWSQFSYDDDGGLVFTALGKRGITRQIPVPEWLEIMIRKYEDIVMDPEYRQRARSPCSSRNSGTNTSLTAVDGNRAGGAETDGVLGEPRNLLNPT